MTRKNLSMFSTDVIFFGYVQSEIGWIHRCRIHGYGGPIVCKSSREKWLICVKWDQGRPPGGSDDWNTRETKRSYTKIPRWDKAKCVQRGQAVWHCWGIKVNRVTGDLGGAEDRGEVIKSLIKYPLEQKFQVSSQHICLIQHHINFA